MQAGETRHAIGARITSQKIISINILISLLPIPILPLILLT